MPLAIHDRRGGIRLGKIWVAVLSIAIRPHGQKVCLCVPSSEKDLDVWQYMMNLKVFRAGVLTVRLGYSVQSVCDESRLPAPIFMYEVLFSFQSPTINFSLMKSQILCIWNRGKVGSWGAAKKRDEWIAFARGATVRIESGLGSVLKMYEYYPGQPTQREKSDAESFQWSKRVRGWYALEEGAYVRWPWKRPDKVTLLARPQDQAKVIISTRASIKTTEPTAKAKNPWERCAVHWTDIRRWVIMTDEVNRNSDIIIITTLLRRQPSVPNRFSLQHASGGFFGSKSRTSCYTQKDMVESPSTFLHGAGPQIRRYIHTYKIALAEQGERGTILESSNSKPGTKVVLNACRSTIKGALVRNHKLDHCWR